MSDMWRSRSPPVPLDFDSIMNESFVLPSAEPEKVKGINGSRTKNAHVIVNGRENSRMNNSAAVTNGLKDQRALTLRDNLLLFVSR